MRKTGNIKEDLMEQSGVQASTAGGRHWGYGGSATAS